MRTCTHIHTIYTVDIYIYTHTHTHSKIPLIWHSVIQNCWQSGMWGNNPEEQKFCFLPWESFNSDTGMSQGHVQRASKSVCTSTVVVPPDPLSPTPSTSSAVKTQGDTKEDPHNLELRHPSHNPEPAAEGDIQMEYSSD